MQTKSNILNKDFDFKVIHLQLTFDENFWVKDEYQIIINGQTFKYFQGIGHRTPKAGSLKIEGQKYLNMRVKKDVESHKIYITKLNSLTNVKPLNIDDILYSLVLDAQSGSLNFDDFCEDFGYNDDSIKHLEIYKKCIENLKKVRKLGFNIDEATELFQDY